MVVLAKKKTFDWKKFIFIVACLALALTHFAMFWVYINIDTIRLTFTDYRAGEFVYIGFKNYVSALKNIFLNEDPGTAKAFWNGFHAIAINLIILPFSVIIAYAFHKKTPGTTFFRGVFYLPSIISMVILAIAFREMFKQNTINGVTVEGPIAQLLGWIGIKPPHSWLSFAEGTKTFWPLIYVFCILNGMGTNVILINGAMQRIPTEIKEASRLDGCGFFKELRYVVLPLVMPTITTWIMLIFTSVLGFYLQPMLIANGTLNGDTTTAAILIFNCALDSTNYNNLISGATLGIILSLFILPFNLISRFFLKKYTAEVTY